MESWQVVSKVARLEAMRRKGSTAIALYQFEDDLVKVQWQSELEQMSAEDKSLDSDWVNSDNASDDDNDDFCNMDF